MFLGVFPCTIFLLSIKMGLHGNMSHDMCHAIILLHDAYRETRVAE